VSRIRHQLDDYDAPPLPITVAIYATCPACRADVRTEHKSTYRCSRCGEPLSGDVAEVPMTDRDFALGIVHADTCIRPDDLTA
jgi:tRNA(Ile2) C34 agmatinyltransferase TiaS